MLLASARLGFGAGELHFATLSGHQSQQPTIPRHSHNCRHAQLHVHCHFSDISQHTASKPIALPAFISFAVLPHFNSPITFTSFSLPIAKISASQFFSTFNIPLNYSAHLFLTTSFSTNIAPSSHSPDVFLIFLSPPTTISYSPKNFQSSFYKVK